MIHEVFRHKETLVHKDNHIALGGNASRPTFSFLLWVFTLWESTAIRDAVIYYFLWQKGFRY